MGQILLRHSDWTIRVMQVNSIRPYRLKIIPRFGLRRRFLLAQKLSQDNIFVPIHARLTPGKTARELDSQHRYFIKGGGALVWDDAINLGRHFASKSFSRENFS